MAQSNTELGDDILTLINSIIEHEHQPSTDDLGKLNEAARRLKFGFTPPEQPPTKSALELKREAEIHAAHMANEERAKNGGMGGMGIVIHDQTSGRIKFFQTAKVFMKWREDFPNGNFLAYRGCDLLMANGQWVNLMDMGELPHISAPAEGS